MTDKLNWFASFEEVAEGRWLVMIADNWRLWMRGTGVIRVKCLINDKWLGCKLEWALFVPELKKNFFSISQVADHGYTTTYTKRACYFADATEILVLIGTLYP